jgi:hypothetical protein
MNPGDKVEILRGIYKDAVGELEQYYQPSMHHSHMAIVVWQGIRIAIDPWDIALADEEEEVSPNNETDTAPAGNL